MPVALSLCPRRLRCLVVDDERASRVMLRTFLNNWAVSCHEAEDGSEAIQWLEEPGHALPDFVLTDIEMPRCDGLTLFRQIRSSSNRAVRELPVAMMSTCGLQELDRTFRVITPLCFFSKPIDLVELRRLIEYFRAQLDRAPRTERPQDAPDVHD